MGSSVRCASRLVRAGCRLGASGLWRAGGGGGARPSLSDCSTDGLLALPIFRPIRATRRLALDHLHRGRMGRACSPTPLHLALRPLPGAHMGWRPNLPSCSAPGGPDLWPDWAQLAAEILASGANFCPVICAWRLKLAKCGGAPKPCADRLGQVNGVATGLAHCASRHSNPVGLMSRS